MKKTTEKGREYERERVTDGQGVGKAVESSRIRCLGTFRFFRSVLWPSITAWLKIHAEHILHE